MDAAEQDSVFSLRKRLNALENEKLDAVAAANQEICRLSADVTRLRAQVEKGEVARQTLEFELAKVNKDLATERRCAAERDACTSDTVDNLQRKISELEDNAERLKADLNGAVESTAQELAHRDSILADKDKAISEQNERIASFVEAMAEAQSSLEQKQRITETLEAEIERIQALNRQLADKAKQQHQETEVIRERTSKTTLDLNQAFGQIQSLEEAMEAERASHIQTKFTCELVQLRVKDLEAALKAEKESKNEAVVNIDKFSNLTRELQQTCDEERHNHLSTKSKLARMEKELETLKRQLTRELAEKRSAIQLLNEQLIKQQSELDQLKSEFSKTKKRYISLEDAYTCAASELELILSYNNICSNNPKHTKDVVSAKMLSSAVQSVRELVLNLKKSNNDVAGNLSTQRLQNEKLTQKLKDCKEKLAGKTKTLQETEAALAQADSSSKKLENDCQRLSSECRKLNAELQRMKQGLLEQQTHSKQLHDQILRVSMKCKTDEQTSATFLTLLRQQLNTATLITDHRTSTLASGAVNVQSEPEDWNDLALQVNEQVSVLVSQYNRAQQKILELEQIVSERDASIDEMHNSHTEQVEQMTRSVEEQNQQWLKLKSELEQHYTQLLEEANSRNKMLQEEADKAWGKMHTVFDVQQNLDATCMQLHSQVERNHRDINCLLATVALFAGTFYPLRMRAVELATQRDILATQVARFEAFKHQIADLVSAMKLGHDSSLNGSVSGSLGNRVTAVLRFRSSVIAVLAANRLVRLLANSCQLFTTRGGSHVGPVYGLMVVAGTELSHKQPAKGGQQTSDRALSFIRSSALHSVCVSAMTELHKISESSDSNSEHITAVAQRCVTKLLTNLAPSFPTLSLPAKSNIDGPLLSGLKRGLWRTFAGQPNRAGEIPPYGSSEDILESLQHCILDFTNRLHTAEVGKRDLRAQLAKLQSVKNSAVDGNDREGSSGLITDQNMNQSLAELQEQIQRLSRKVDDLHQEKSSLQDKVRDAETALRTSSRDKQALANYVASVEDAVGPCDANALEWPSEQLLPAELGDAGGLSRRNATLTAVRAMVMSFVLAHNRLICRLVSSREEANQLKRHVERLKLEVEAASRHTPPDAHQALDTGDTPKSSTLSVISIAQSLAAPQLNNNVANNTESVTVVVSEASKLKNVAPIVGRPTKSAETQPKIPQRKSRLARYSPPPQTSTLKNTAVQKNMRPVTKSTSVYRH